MSKHAKSLVIVYLILGMALFGSATPISKLVGQHFPVLTASLFRVLLGALTLLPFVVTDLKTCVVKIQKSEWIALSLIALFGMVGFTVFLIIGMKYLSGVAGSIVMSFTPALTAFAAWLFLRESLGFPKIIAIILGVAGIFIINFYKEQFSITDTRSFYIGLVFVLLAISCEASYTLIGKKATKTLPPLLVSFLACVLSLPVFMLLAFFDYQHLHVMTINATAWLALLWWGMATLGAGSALWYAGVAKAQGSIAAGFMAIMPVSALLLSYFLLGESFHPIQLLGIGLVFVSLLLMSWVHMHAR